MIIFKYYGWATADKDAIIVSQCGNPLVRIVGIPMFDDGK